MVTHPVSIYNNSYARRSWFHDDDEDDDNDEDVNNEKNKKYDETMSAEIKTTMFDDSADDVNKGTIVYYNTDTGLYWYRH